MGGSHPGRALELSGSGLRSCRLEVTPGAGQSREQAMTIDDVVQWVWMLLLVLGPLAVWIGWRRVATANRLRFYLLRRKRASAGWRWILVGVVLVFAAVAVWRLGRQAA